MQGWYSPHGSPSCFIDYMAGDTGAHGLRLMAFNNARCDISGRHYQVRIMVGG